MLNRFFEYAMKNATTFIKKITFKDNVVTLYNGQPENVTEQNEFRLLDSLRQKNCGGKPYSKLTTADRAHRIINPHANLTEIHDRHWHLAACDLLRPADVANLLKNILELQSDQHRLATFTQHNKHHLEALYARVGKENVQINMGSELFISREDAGELLKEYKKYYQENGGKLTRQYQQHQQELGWQGQAAELGYTALRSAHITVGFELIREAMKIRGVSRGMREAIMMTLTYLALAISSEDITAVMRAALVTLLLSKISAFNQSSQAKTALSVGLSMVNSGVLNSRFDTIKFTVSCISSWLAASCVQSVSNYFYQQPPEPEQRNRVIGIILIPARR